MHGIQFQGALRGPDESVLLIIRSLTPLLKDGQGRYIIDNLVGMKCTLMP